MAHPNTYRKKSSLAELIFPPAAPAVMRILSVVAAAVLIAGGILLACGYFSDDVQEPGATVTHSTAQTPTATVSPQEAESASPSARPEIIPAGLSFRGGSGNIYYSDDAIVLHPGDTAFLELLADGDPVDREQTTWKSFDESVFTVTDGEISAISAGEAQCRATYSANNQSISITVTVNEPVGADGNGSVSPGTVFPSDQDTPASAPSQNQAPVTTAPPQAEPTETPVQTSNITLTPVEPADPRLSGMSEVPAADKAVERLPDL